MKSFRPAYRSKSAQESIQRRQQGNEVFKQKDYRKALVFYNQAVIYAPYSKTKSYFILIWFDCWPFNKSV